MGRVTQPTPKQLEVWRVYKRCSFLIQGRGQPQQSSRQRIQVNNAVQVTDVQLTQRIHFVSADGFLIN